MKLSICLILACAALRAEPVLLTYDGSGRLLRQDRAVVRAGGFALAPRDALFGAASATLLDDNGRLHPVLWISADDADAGVLELYIGAQAPRGPDPATALGKRVKTPDHEASVRYTKESGGFGVISRLDCGGPADTRSGPLYDEHGLLAGWHAVKVVDGQILAFAIPLARLDAVNATRHLSLAQWNAAHDAAREADYQRGLGHLWADDFEGASYYFRKATESDPANARAWYHLAFAEGKLGHGKAKTAAYRKAVELDPAFPPAHYYLGFSLLMNGDRDGAVKEYEQLKKLDASWALRLKLFLDTAHVDILDKNHVHNHNTQLR
jgi:tetratricopeptide (TPR) repeat protein